MPIDEYDSLYKRFNPIEFDARQWVRIARDAGMRYIVLTTKHHDGFCLWDSALTDYDIMSTPFARDVVAELSAACRSICAPRFSSGSFRSNSLAMVTPSLQTIGAPHFF